ncbi:MAG: CBS domain-containing protein [Bryobacteraceae bacterium]|nr:CBS domain-containing protein [Bryobacteraceae bacterium]
MTVSSLMNTNPITVTLEDTFGGALDILLKHRVRSLPVLDSNGIYRGMFDLYDLWELLLPRAALLEGKRIADLAYMPGSEEMLREKLGNAQARSIVEFLDDQESPAIYSDTTVIEAILLLHRRGGNLPVVERQTRKLVGIVTPWEILSQVQTGKDTAH